MGVSLTNCYNKNVEDNAEDNKAITDFEEGKKLKLRSNPKSIAEKIMKKGDSSLTNAVNVSKNSNKSSAGKAVPGLNLKSDRMRKGENNIIITESSDSSTGFSSNRKLADKFSFKKRINENFVLNNSSLCSSEKKKFPHGFVKEKEEDTFNKFLVFEHSHRQVSFLSKSFKTIIEELNIQLDEFLEKEVVRNKTLFPGIEFSVVAIVERQNGQNHSSNKTERFNTNNSNTNNISNSIGSSHESKDADVLLKFFVVSNIFIYDFEFASSQQYPTLTLKRKINLLSIDFFSITPDFRKLIIHINNVLDEGGNIFIFNDNSIHIVFCICNLLFYCYSLTKNLIVIPKSQFFFEKIKKIHNYEKMKDFFNSYAESIYNKIGEVVPFDKDETFIKLIPLSKIETKFTDMKVDKMLVLSDKKIIEVCSDNVEISKLNIIPLSKMKKINEFNKSQKFQIVLDDESVYQYSSIHIKMLLRLIKAQHAKECLLDLEIDRMD